MLIRNLKSSSLREALVGVLRVLLPISCGKGDGSQYFRGDEFAQKMRISPEPVPGYFV
jgi:hypothetical protein